MLAESALCLAFDELPQTAGQVTPVAAMGDALLDRLVRAGLSFRVLKQDTAEHGLDPRPGRGGRMPSVSDLHSIGELARASGLTVSALRFYDSAGVLEPALVDPVTGYRWYTDEQIAPARLVAGLRRIGMPVPEIAAAVRAEPGGGAPVARHAPAPVGRRAGRRPSGG